VTGSLTVRIEIMTLVVAVTVVWRYIVVIVVAPGR
jgi:hypothetical protein